MQVTLVNNNGGQVTYNNVESFQINKNSLTVITKDGSTLGTLISLSHDDFKTVTQVGIMV